MSRWYPEIDDVLALHDMQLKLFGGAPGIRDMGQLESALFRPQTGYYKDIIEEAAALWESFMQNHPFIDGNKRTALNVTLLFLAVNGIECSASDDETTDCIYGLFDQDDVTFKSLDAWLRSNTRVA
jgi:death-on-curing protein